jgi:hypothetical protein
VKQGLFAVPVMKIPGFFFHLPLFAYKQSTNRGAIRIGAAKGTRKNRQSRETYSPALPIVIELA